MRTPVALVALLACGAESGERAGPPMPDAAGTECFAADSYTTTTTLDRAEPESLECPATLTLPPFGPNNPACQASDFPVEGCTLGCLYLPGPDGGDIDLLLQHGDTLMGHATNRLPSGSGCVYDVIALPEE